MKRVRILKDFAILDKGPEEENPFVIVEDVVVNADGSLADPDLGAKVMSNEAVRKGATRINGSDCVEIDPELKSYNDKIVAFNGGDLYVPYDGEWARQQVVGWDPVERERALEYINHRENRYAFMLASGLISEDANAEYSTEPTKGSFIDDVKDWLGI